MSNQVYRKFLLPILLLALLLLLAGCGDANVPAVDTTAVTEADTTEASAPTGLVLVEDGTVKYTIIRPEETNTETIKAASLLCSVIE